MAFTPKIVFISHDASRTGAPIVFLNFLRWFKANSDIPFLIILRRGGSLESEFADLAPTFVFEKYISYTLWQRGLHFCQRILKRLKLLKNADKQGYKIRQLRQFIGKSNIDLIYSNTATNHEILEALSFLDVPVISHVHELEYGIRRFAGHGFEKTKQLTTYFIACSNAVRNNLIIQHGIPPLSIGLVHGFIHLPSLPINPYDIRARLGFSEKDFIVGASGTTEWRKGSDLFIQLAYIVEQKNKNNSIKFLWVGGDENDEHLQHDIVNTMMAKTIHFIGAKPNPLDYFASFDLFVLMSREDPYPLVCLEAASLGKPIICFDKAGGEPEFVENDCGFVIPYLNLDVMSNRIIELYQSPALCRRLGQNAKDKVSQRHNINTSAPNLLRIIKQHL